MPSRATRYYEAYWQAADYAQRNNAENPSVAHDLLNMVAAERARVEGHRRLAEESVAALDRGALGDVVKVVLVKSMKTPHLTQIREWDARLRELAQLVVTVQALVSSERYP